MTVLDIESSKVIDLERFVVSGEIDVDQRHLNRGGIVRAGALLPLAADLGRGVAGLNISDDSRTVTIESKRNIFHACPPGQLTGRPVPLHIGRRKVVVHTSFYRYDDKLSAMMTQTS